MAGDEADAGHEWQFRLTPYAWFLNVDGDFTVQALNKASSDADLYDDLQGTFMIEGEARYGPFAVYSEYNYIDLDQSASALNGTIKADVNVSGIMSSFTGGYRFLDDGQFTADAFGGARLWWIDTTVSFRRLQSLTVDRNWVDPIVGLRGSVEIAEGVFFDGVGDVGGFGVGSELQWELIGRGGYRFNDQVAVALGYRYLKVDFDDNPLVLDAAFQGPFLAVDVNF